MASIFLDPSRVAPATDPAGRLAHISIGAFIETVVIAASGHGLAATVDIGAASDRLSEGRHHPIATLTFAPDASGPDRLARHISARRTNRRAYHGPPVTDDERAALVAAAAPRASLVFPDGSDAATLRRLMRDAMRADTWDDATHLEKVAMIRVSDAEGARAGDGFTYPNLGYTGRWRRRIERAYPLSGGSSRWFRWGTMLVARRVLWSTRAIGVLIAPGNTTADQVQTGRALTRLWLRATELELAVHPMCQALQEDETRADIRRRLRSLTTAWSPNATIPTTDRDAGTPTVQVLFRLGRAAPTPPSPRRTIDEVLDA